MQYYSSSSFSSLTYRPLNPLLNPSNPFKSSTHPPPGSSLSPSSPSSLAARRTNSSETLAKTPPSPPSTVFRFREGLLIHGTSHPNCAVPTRTPSPGPRRRPCRPSTESSTPPRALGETCTSTVDVGGRISGRKDRERGQIGVSKMEGCDGWISGPDAERE